MDRNYNRPSRARRKPRGLALPPPAPRRGTGQQRPELDDELRAFLGEAPVADWPSASESEAESER